MARTRYWLMKSEPSVFSFDDLWRSKKRTTFWDGVRNYQARNLMRDEMKVGDDVLFYHSNAKPPGVAGLARVCKEAYPDHTAWDKKSKYFDAKSTPEDPRWFMVDVEFVEKFPAVLSLTVIKEDPRFDDMMLTRKGARLSVQPVSKKHFNSIAKQARKG